MSYRRFAACLLLSTAIGACSDDGDEGGSAGGEPSPPQVCEDMADAVAEAAVRCGQEYQANYDAFISVAAAGDCENIISIRDVEEMYDTCLPSLESVSCDDLTAGVIDDACVAQLERPAGLTCDATSPMAACVEVDDLASGS